MAQDVPMKDLGPDGQKQSYHWSLEPTHLVLLPDDSYLIGNQWEGLYLLAKDHLGKHHFTALDEKVGPDTILSELLTKQ